MNDKIFSLCLQKPKPSKKPLSGILDINAKTLKATFWDDRALLASMDKVEIVHASSIGILLRGFEEGAFKNGRRIYNYQEWWLVFIVGE